MRTHGHVFVLVNAGAQSALGERARWVAKACGTTVQLAYRPSGRLGAAMDFVRQIVRGRPAAVYLVDNALTTTVAGSVARLAGARVILDTGDAVGKLARKTGQGSAAGAALASVVERFGYLLADTIVARSDGLADHIRALCGKAAVVVPDGFDPSRVSPGGGERYRRYWGIGDSQVAIGVVGSARWNARLRWCYGRDVIEVIAAVKRRDVVGVIVARGDGVRHLRALSDDRGVAGRIVFADPGDAGEVWEQLDALDIGLSTQTNDAVGRARTTGKLVQYMAAGKFILASRVGTAARILPPDMLVDYDGEWDEDYFAKLAARVDDLPGRSELATRGAHMIETAAPFSYERLVESLRAKVFEPSLRPTALAATPMR